MEEIRIDCLNQTEQELAAAKELRQDIFLLNHTMPDTDEYQDLLHKVFLILEKTAVLRYRSPVSEPPT